MSIKMEISYCSTCFNRFEQLRMTLPENLKLLRHFPNAELLLVNFVRLKPKSDDQGSEIHEWILRDFADEIRNNNLKYVLSKELEFWHASIAKNIAHDVATGEFLINTDCDNFLSTEEISFLIDRYAANIIYHGWSGKYLDGTYGHIGFHKNTFAKLGGYDESLKPHAGQDEDLLNRAKAMTNFEVVQFKDRRAIPNDKNVGIKNTGSALSWREMQKYNLAKSVENIDNSEYFRPRLHKIGDRKIFSANS